MHVILAVPAAAASAHVSVTGLSGSGVMLFVALILFLVGMRFLSGLVLGLSVWLGAASGVIGSLATAGVDVWNGIAHVFNAL